MKFVRSMFGTNLQVISTKQTEDRRHTLQEVMKMYWYFYGQNVFSYGEIYLKTFLKPLTDSYNTSCGWLHIEVNIVIYTTFQAYQLPWSSNKQML